jgi:hypothetical protein
MNRPFPANLSDVGTTPEEVVADMTAFEGMGSWPEMGGKPEWFEKMERIWRTVTGTAAPLEVLKGEAWRMAAKEAVNDLDSFRRNS